MDAGVSEGDVALRDDLLADGAPGGGVTLAATSRPGLDEKLLTQPFLAELTSEEQLEIFARQGWKIVKKNTHLKQFL